MIWMDLEVGDVLMSSYQGDVSAYLMVRREPPESRLIDEVEITMLCLNSARQTTHSRRARSDLSPTYTVLRGANVEQQGDGDVK